MSGRFAALFAFLILVIALLAVAVWLLLEERSAHPVPTGPVPATPEPLEPELVLEAAGFGDLPGWEEERPAAALPALRASCRVFRARAPGSAVGADRAATTAGDWRRFCSRLASLGRAPAVGAVRALIEEELTPWAVTDRGRERYALLTGYYEPELRGSRRRHGDYRIPLHRVPGDLVTADLGEFREDLEGRTIAGRVVGRELVPYPERAEIAAGALAGRDLELVWVDDPVDAFFLQVQGSGRVVLEGGTVLRVGYAGQNGWPYFAIGRELVERGALTLEEVSLQSIRRWLEENPEEADEVMATNPSYVFFRELRGPGPLGSLGVPLTAGRSLAVDARFLPLGAPLWLAGEAPRLPEPFPEGGTPEEQRPVGSEPLRRLVVAQDTGGAIRGPLRGDLFWGPGERAEVLAGHMKHPGRLWLLLPSGTRPGLSSSEAAGAP